jgi:tRNA-modifying protein YgfZ
MSTRGRYAVLEHRSVIAVDGEDRTSFLQGLVSNDVTRAGDGRAIYAALLTPQGRFLHDLFIVESRSGYLVECERDRRQDLLRRLGLYRLRSRVVLSDRSDELSVAAVMNDDAISGLGLDGAAHDPAIAPDLGVMFADPRHPTAGARALLPTAILAETFTRIGCELASLTEYDRHRIRLGLPDGSRDMTVEKSLLLECGFDALNGVDWDKGCYLGQELTARSKYRGLVRRRLVPIAFDGAPPPPGTAILADGIDVGDVRSSTDSYAMAVVRIEALERQAELFAGAMPVRVALPDWLHIGETA